MAEGNGKYLSKFEMSYQVGNNCIVMYNCDLLGQKHHGLVRSGQSTLKRKNRATEKERKFRIFGVGMIC